MLDLDFDHPLFRDYPDAIFTLSISGKFTSANRVLLEIVECSYEELIKCSLAQLIPPEDLDEMLGTFQTAIDGKVLNFETRIISFNGNVKYLNLTQLPIVSDQAVVGVYLIAKDITSVVHDRRKLKQQQKKLNAHYQRTSTILESITDGFLAVDQDWVVIYWNSGAERILQLPREEITGKKLWEFYPRETYPNVYVAYEKAKREQITVHVEEFVAPLNVWLELSAFPSDKGLSIHFKDITGRKESEIKLTELQKQYKDLFELNPVPQFVYATNDMALKDVNQAAIEHYGYSKAELLEMTIKDIVFHEDLPRLDQILEERVRVEADYVGIIRHVKKNGEVIDVQITGNSTVFEGEKARLVLAVDITEKFRAQTELQRSEQRFKGLIQDGSDMIGILTREGEYVYVNQTVQKILGVPPEFFIGKNALDFVHEQDRTNFQAGLERLDSQKTTKLPAFQFKDSQGKYRWIDTVLTDMTDDPSVGGIVANSRDVTERVEDLTKIQQSIDRFNIVAKATSEAIWDCDVLTGVIIWNKAIESVFGYSQSQSSFSWWEQRIHSEDAAKVNQKVINAIESKSDRLEVDYRFRCGDGSYKHVLDRSFMVYNESGELTRIIGSMQDTTERERYVQTVESQNKRLRDIAWMQSHIVRAPLANIIGIVELLRNGVNDPANREELLQYLSNSAHNLEAIIGDIVKSAEMIDKQRDEL